MQDKRLIIVDDEIDLCEVMADLLSDYVPTDFEPDASKLQDRFEQQSYDFCLLDMNMPGLRGEEAIKVIRKISPNTKIVMFTGDNSLEGKAAEFGADGCIIKPCLEPEMIVELLKTLG